MKQGTPFDPADILRFAPLLHGDEIRPQDARRFLQSLHDDPALRAACRGLGYLSAELSAEIREDRFRDCLGLLLSSVTPPTTTVTPWVPLTPAMLNAPRGRPFLPGRWRQHATLQRAEGAKHRVVAVLVTAELAERIDALQNFWGLPRFAVVLN